MGALKLEIPGPQTVNEVGVDPDPDWSFDSLLSELNSLENKLKSSSQSSFHFSTSQSRGFSTADKSSRGAFVMRVSDDEIEDFDSEVENEEKGVAKGFRYDDIYLCESDDSDYEFVLDSHTYLMDGAELVESSLFELSQEHQLGVKEEIRNKISELEMELVRDGEKFSSALTRVEKYKEARRESDRKLHAQYQRKIAEALDNHLTSIQRDHELKSQVEERRLRSDAAHEDAKRKDKALQEERLRQERVRVEAEAKRKAEEAKRASLEVEERAAKEAAEASKKQAAAVSQQDISGQKINASSSNQDVSSQGFISNETKKTQLTGNSVMAAQSALSIEQKRLDKLKALKEQNQSLKLRFNEDFSSHERHIARLIKTIRGAQENVRTRSSELVGICKTSSFPQPISLAAFATYATKFGSQSGIPVSAVFAFAHVIVAVTSQVPYLMDLLLAEFHKACIYTVPKHIAYSKSAFESGEAYKKTIGYEERDGKIESTSDFLSRLECHMRLYGALVQTEVRGVQNTHGPREGWAWLARFLNNLPANIFTAVALKAFLTTAGFVLFKKYKSQFGKMLNYIYTDFLAALRKLQDSELNATIMEIQYYIEDKKFLQEPEGSRLEVELRSSTYGA